MTIKKFICIVKINDQKFLRYHVNDLLKFTLFLDGKFPDWRWFNVYAYEGNNKSLQIGNFTRNDKPSHRHIQF